MRPALPYRRGVYYYLVACSGASLVWQQLLAAFQSKNTLNVTNNLQKNIYIY